MLRYHLINANLLNRDVAINLFQLIDLFIYKIINQCYANKAYRIKEPQTINNQVSAGYFKITECLGRHQNVCPH